MSPAGTGWQEPAFPVTAQEKQAPQLGVPQQTPSTQLILLSHSILSAHCWPRRFLPQVPALQTLPGAQSALVTQEAMQVVPLHAKGEHDWVVGARHTPRPSQVRARVAVVPLVGQTGATHSTPAA
jgi:hypothetical protein